MSDDAKPGPTVPAGVRTDDEYGRMTHTERLNPGDNPADGTGASPGAAPGAPPKPDDESKFGPLRAYRLLADAFDGVRRKAGELVMLYDHQVGAHHQALTEDGRVVEVDPRAQRLKLAGDRIVATASGIPQTEETEMSPEQFAQLMAALEPIAECSRRVLVEMDRQAATMAAIEAGRLRQAEADKATTEAATEHEAETGA